ncbi:glycoside hydrolase family 43 protein [Allorhodopirellula solitaria]|uniref:Extracellular exo-alpha-(1->5)-L-arabinofuranosidase n=1 Tax=Allorhodopirellula solitaria TaxID=2527987 RepID=A0A5C5XRE9_9BACT|nr:glycoside hydrolase family 43 protein [Allorhodopirellula solitaria]TWT65209.1 Extracellular exo-alpha-(1->5)-L-arabinofuranosidase precursor [Allorhodopirellula solitaria]
MSNCAPFATSLLAAWVALAGLPSLADDIAADASEAIQRNEQSSADTFTNPLLPSGPDPWTIYHEGMFYYIRSAGGGIVLMRTPDITQLRRAEKQVIWKAPPGTDHSKEIWAPEIHYLRGKWYVYVAADDGQNANHRMFVLENAAEDPFTGSFEVKSKLKTDAEDNWAIDGSVFEHAGELYFVWSGWAEPPTDSETQNIYIARMADPWTIDSERVLLSTPELPWERHWEGLSRAVYVNEGPQILVHGSKMHIVYSASGCWTPDYALGLLTADATADPMNPDAWTKSPQPVFQQSPERGVYGTGHNCFFKSPDGREDWILYHANDNPEDGCGNKRSPRAQPFRWSDEDMPIFGKPVATSTPLKKPSGTP